MILSFDIYQKQGTRISNKYFFGTNPGNRKDEIEKETRQIVNSNLSKLKKECLPDIPLNLLISHHTSASHNHLIFPGI